MLKVYEQITSLKKAATKREAEKKEMADVVEQERLIEAKGKLRRADSGILELNTRPTSLCAQECLSPSSGRGKEDGW